MVRRFAEVIARLRPLHSAEVIEAWQGMAETGAYEALAGDLMARHYDPRYDKHRARAAEGGEAVVDATSLATDALGGLADRIMAEVDRLGAR